MSECPTCYGIRELPVLDIYSAPMSSSDCVPIGYQTCPDCTVNNSCIFCRGDGYSIFWLDSEYRECEAVPCGHCRRQQ